jgi:hypothetical protein
MIQKRSTKSLKRHKTGGAPIPKIYTQRDNRKASSARPSVFTSAASLTCKAQQLANILLCVEKLNTGYKCLSFKLRKMLEQKIINYSMHIEIKL